MNLPIKEWEIAECVPNGSEECVMVQSQGEEDAFPFDASWSPAERATVMKFLAMVNEAEDATPPKRLVLCRRGGSGKSTLAKWIQSRAKRPVQIHHEGLAVDTPLQGWEIVCSLPVEACVTIC